MINCVVEMWGFAREVSGIQQVEISLDDDAVMKDALRELRKRVPALDGTVIEKEEDKLDDSSAFNVNGQFYDGGDTVKLHDGDRIRLLTMATGG